MKSLLKYFVLFGLLSCSKSESETVTNKPKQIVLIFDKIQENSRYKFPSGISTNSGFELRYYDDDFLPQYISPNPEKSDTIRIIQARDFLDLQHCYMGQDELSFFCKNGDTIRFGYEALQPHALAARRQCKNLDLNYEMLIRKLVHRNDFPAIVKARIPFAFHRFTDEKNFDRDYKDLQDKFIEIAFLQIKQEAKILDSLLLLKKITPEIARLYFKQQKYDSTNLIFFRRQSDFDISRHLLNDSLLYFGFYNEFLDRIIGRYYSLKVAKVRNGNAIVPDYTAIYDSIKINDSFTQKTKNVLLRKTLEEIIQAYPVDKVKLYISEFQKRDTIAANYLIKKFRLNFDNSAQLRLLSTDHKVTSLDSLIKINRGKLIYVDFWASWCGPCIQQFPFSKALKKKYEGKAVLFLYLSMDTDSAKWKRASSKYKLENSFLIDNRYSSTLVKELQVSSIPRYLLYDKQGKLVHKNAPRPEGETIVELIENYLRN